MKLSIKLLIIISLSFLVSFASTNACGPSFPEPVFSFSVRPENFNELAQDNIGIIQPTWHRSALLIAYRTLHNLPLSKGEQKQILRNWQVEYQFIDANEDTKKTAIDNWLKARTQILKSPAEQKIDPLKAVENNYNYFLNCTASAFDTATNTLANRIKNYGVNEDTKDWLMAQDSVFANCAEIKTIPQPVADNKAQWLKDDRAYQIAAAYFYAMDYDKASQAFNQITQNKNSSWQLLSQYLLARIAVRQASTNDDTAKAQPLYENAITIINNIIANPQLSDYHHSAGQLLNYVNFKINPSLLHKQLSDKLVNAKDNADFLQDITDYRRLLDKADINLDESDNSKNLYAQFINGSDITDWLFTIQSKQDNAFAHAYARWQSTKDTAWLLASLIKATANNSEAAQLQQQALAIKTDSPAYLTAHYHAARLAIGQAQFDDARKTLDAVLTNTGLINNSSRSLLLAQRMLVANSIEEFVQYAQRKATIFAFAEDKDAAIDLNQAIEGLDFKQERQWLARNMFDIDAVRAFNLQTPLLILKKVALHSELPDYLKPSVLMSVWTRAILLNDDKTAIEFAPYIEKYIPQLAPFIKRYSQADTEKNRHYEAVWLMLNNPAMRPLVDKAQGRLTEMNKIDNFQDNWWCDSSFDYSFYNEQGEQVTDFAAPSFLNKTDIEQAKKENAQMAQLKGAANFLISQTLQWAKHNPNDARLPEALHLAIRATRYGCGTCVGKESKAAFELLNSRFNNSAWQKKTRYWFGELCDK